MEESTAIIPQQISSECSLFASADTSGGSSGATCSSASTVSRIAQVLNITGSAAPVMDKAKEKLGCSSEKCVLQKVLNANKDAAIERDLMLNFRVEGPTDTKLLSNTNIDNVLAQCAIKFPNFYHYNFNMLDYANHSFNVKTFEVLNTPDTLATVKWSDIKAQGKNCAACVINSDVYHGPGKHWMALFLDARDEKHCTVEFFNSAGTPPAPEWINWMVKMRQQLEADESAPDDRTVELVRVISIKHQKSRTECGLYSLYYVISRLHGIPAQQFNTIRVPDELMFEFRYHLFDDASREKITEFNFEKYKQTTNIKWM